LNFTNI